jgi:hypothetical protein
MGSGLRYVHGFWSPLRSSGGGIDAPKLIKLIPHHKAQCNKLGRNKTVSIGLIKINYKIIIIKIRKVSYIDG